MYRYITIRDKDDFPENAIRQLLESAYENAIARLKPVKKIVKGETIVKSVSTVKRRPQ